MSAPAYLPYRAAELPAEGDTITVTAQHDDGGTSTDTLTVTRVGSTAGWGTLPNGEEVRWEFVSTKPTPIDVNTPVYVQALNVLSDLIDAHPDAAPLLLDAIAATVRDTTYPALTAETVTDDGETFRGVRCPWCDELVSEGDTLIVVDEAVRWTRVDADEFDHERHNIDPDYQGLGDYETLHYLHETCGKPVDLPEGWEER